MGLIEDNLALQVPQDPELSPNSQLVVFATSVRWIQKTADQPNALSRVWLAETGKKHSTRQLTSGLYNDQTPKWRPDGGSIAFISDRAKAGESSALYELPMSGGEALPLTEVKNERPIVKFDYSPDGKSIAFLSADEKSEKQKTKEKDKDDAIVWDEDLPYVRLRLLDIATKTVTTLTEGNAHITDLAWDDRGSRIATVEQKSTDIESPDVDGTDIAVVDVASKESKKLCHFPTNAQDLTWCGGSLYFRASVIPDSVTSASAIYSVSTTSTSSEIGYEYTAYGKENCAMGIRKAGGDLTVYVQEGMEDQLRILNGRTVFSRKQIIQSAALGFTHDSDEMVIAVVLSDINNPCEVYTTTSSGGALVQLSDFGHVFAGKTLGTVNFISCQTLDEQEDIQGIYITPTGKEGADGFPQTPLSTVVLIHGGPYYRITNAWDPMHFWTPPILESGHGVLIINYRGSSGRGQQIAKYGRGGMGKYDEPDIVAMTQYAIEKGWADKGKLIVGGASQGGFLTFLSAVRNGLHGFGWKFRGAMPYAGVTDWDTMCLSSDVGNWEGEYAGICPWDAKKHDTSSRQGSALWEFSNAVEKGGVIPPMLITHGEKDVRVPIEQAHGFRRALQRAKLPFEFVIYPREGHMMEEKKHIEDWAWRIQRFVDAHLA
ncbi:alpha/beta-hydrolase [Polychaeton citri CBS 116435]|uniref:Dipeptidyl-peptidase V n=1 Tax=Polychaeton citri CBS 116435 TaxID=1314669 RepID=A0A9P4Q847_9PEZI|nr:alpha/beta-hydrolase [Polychaeton citri CBS 116435]